MITVKNKQLDPETIDILNELVETDIPAVSAFKLMKTIRELDEIVQNRQKSEINLVNRYAVKGEDGNLVAGKDKNGNPIDGTFEIEDGKMEEFNKQIEELLEYENHLGEDPFTIEELGNINISAKKLIKLDFLFA